MTLAGVLFSDPVHPGTSNVRGVLSFGAEYDADEMAISRSTEIFVNLADNQRLDAHGQRTAVNLSLPFLVCPTAFQHCLKRLRRLVNRVLSCRLGCERDGGGRRALQRLRRDAGHLHAA